MGDFVTVAFDVELLTSLYIRYHTVQEFNKGVYDYIIATDEGGVGEEDGEDGAEEGEEECESAVAPIFPH